MSALVEPSLDEQAASSASNLPAEEKRTPGNDSLSLGSSFLEELHEMVAREPLEFNTWTSLICDIEKNNPDNMEAISAIYDSFLSQFPLCHLYWKKYAYHKARLCTTDKAFEIFERALQSLTYSVSLWVEYCNFAVHVCEDPSDVHRLFKRALVFVGKDYLCHALWDKYIEYEFSQQQWSSIAHIYIQALRFPTKKLHNYYDNFKKLIDLLKEEIENCTDDDQLQLEAVNEGAGVISEAEISIVIKELEYPLDSSHRSKALQKYLYIGEQFYKKACLLNERIICYENCIQRPFFHVKPVDVDELKSWHHYLDFIEKQEDFDWAVKLYERCLISCATYPEFWMRYVDYMEIKGGRELEDYAFERATKIHFQNVPEIHICYARFKEQIGDVCGARDLYMLCSTKSDSDFIGSTVSRANSEKRMGNIEAASLIYEKALEVAAEENRCDTVPILYVNFFRLKYQVTGNSDAAQDVLIDGLRKVPYCKLLLEELIKFALMHEGSKQINKIDPIVATAISSATNEYPGFCTKDAEDISRLYLEFVDLCGTIQDLRKAWNRHIKLFPHSVRITISPDQPASSSRLLNLLNIKNEGRERNRPALSTQPLSNHNSDDNIPSTVHDNVECLPDDNPIQTTHTFTGQTQTKKDDDIGLQVVSLTADVQFGRHAFGTDKLVDQSVSTQMESIHDPIGQPEDGASGRMQTTHDASEPGIMGDEFDQPSKAIEPSRAPQEHTTELTIQQGGDHEYQKHADSISLEGLTLSSQEKTTEDVVPMAFDNNGKGQENFTSHGSELEVVEDNRDANHFSASPFRNLVNGSTKTNNELDKAEHPVSRGPHPAPEMYQNSGDHQYHYSHMIKDSGNVASGFQGCSPSDQSIRQHSPAQVSSNAENQGYSQSPSWNLKGKNQCNMAGSQGNASTSQAGTSDRIPQHSPSSSSHIGMAPIPVSYSQAQLANFPMQNSPQIEDSEHNKAYYQMLEYHYHQQQQQYLQQYQQQLLQMQQSYLQQQQSYQQLQQFQPQQHQIVHQHHQQQRQQQQQQQQYQQFAQQLEPQAQQQFQQYYQIGGTAYQQYQQTYQQQADQGYHMLVQQYNAQQEQYQQMLQQYQLQQEEECKQRQHQQSGQVPEKPQQDEEWQHIKKGIPDVQGI